MPEISDHPTALPVEPAGGILAWFDKNGHPYAVFFKDPDDDFPGAPDQEWWFNADQRTGDDPLTWEEVLDEMDGFDGPHELTRTSGGESR